jgi:hypothetical protein
MVVFGLAAMGGSLAGSKADDGRFHASVAIKVKSAAEGAGFVVASELRQEVSPHEAENIKNKIRDIDVAARWAGEEFVLMLPETERMGASLSIRPQAAVGILWSRRIRDYCTVNPLKSSVCSFGISPV